MYDRAKVIELNGSQPLGTSEWVAATLACAGIPALASRDSFALPVSCCARPLAPGIAVPSRAVPPVICMCCTGRMHVQWHGWV